MVSAPKGSCFACQGTTGLTYCPPSLLDSSTQHSLLSWETGAGKSTYLALGRSKLGRGLAQRQTCQLSIAARQACCGFGSWLHPEQAWPTQLLQDMMYKVSERMTSVRVQYAYSNRAHDASSVRARYGQWDKAHDAQSAEALSACWPRKGPLYQSYKSPGQPAGKMKDLARALSTAVASCVCIHAVLIAPDGGI